MSGHCSTRPVSTERIDPRLIDAGPRQTPIDRTRFEKLKEAYVKTRYSKHYRITEKDLLWLGRCVEELGQTLFGVHCSARGSNAVVNCAFIANLVRLNAAQS